MHKPLFPMAVSMRSGYLYVETSDSHPGLARIVASEFPPRLPPPGTGVDPAVRYLARFNDLDAGRMHAHAALRWRLVDIEADLYRIGIVDAVSAVEAVGLRHERLYLDPGLADEPQLRVAIRRRVAARRLGDRVWQGVGIAGAIFLILLVLLNLVSGI